MGEKKAKVLYTFQKIFGIANLISLFVASCIAFGYVGLKNMPNEIYRAFAKLYHDYLQKVINDKLGAIAVCVVIFAIILGIMIFVMTRDHATIVGTMNLFLFLFTLPFAVVKGDALGRYWSEKTTCVINGKEAQIPFMLIFNIAYILIIVCSLMYFIFSTAYTTIQANNVIYLNTPDSPTDSVEEKTESNRNKKPGIIVNGKVELGNEIQILAYGHEAYAKVTEYDGQIMEEQPADISEFEVSEIIYRNSDGDVTEKTNDAQDNQLEENNDVVSEEPIVEESVEESNEKETVSEEMPIEEETPVEEEIIQDEISQPIEENEQQFDEVEETTLDDVNEENEAEDEDEEADESDDEDEATTIDFDQKGMPIINAKKVSFDEKVENASDSIKQHYNEIKNVIMNYRNVHTRLSNSGDSFRCKGQKYVFMSIIGKTLKVYIAVDPYSIDQNVYHHRDASNKKKYQSTPTLLRVKSDLSCKKAIKLIEAMFEDNMIPKKRKTEEVDYVKDLLDQLAAKKEQANAKKEEINVD